MRHLTTRAVRVGQYQDLSDAHSEPVGMTSAYVFASAADAASKFSGAVRGNVYSRFTNPTVRAFERRLAALEGAEDAVGFASGMADLRGVLRVLGASLGAMDAWLVTHPASTTHGKLLPEERRGAGISDRMVRLSVGLEHEDDLMSDIDAALAFLPTAASLALRDGQPC